MKRFNAGERARIIDAPIGETRLIGEIVTMLAIGGFGYEDDDVMIRTASGRTIAVKERDLQPVQP